MRHRTRTALIVMLLGAWIITAPQATQGADRDARAPRDPVQFSPPTFVDPPKVLLGDAGNPRCPDPSQPCLQNVDDLLFGRTHILCSDDFVFGFQGGRGSLSVMTLGWDMPTRARLQRPPPAPREVPESLDADRGVLVT